MQTTDVLTSPPVFVVAEQEEVGESPERRQALVHEAMQELPAETQTPRRHELLERYAEDPDFLDDPDAAITYAANRVGWQVRKERYHAARIGISDAQFTDDPDDGSVAEAYPATTNPWPAVHRRMAISTALEQLNTRDQQIATGLAWGYSVRERRALSCHSITPSRCRAGNARRGASPVCGPVFRRP